MRRPPCRPSATFDDQGRPLCVGHGVPMIHQSHNGGWGCRVNQYAALARHRQIGIDIVEDEIVERGSRCLDCGMAYEVGLFDWHHRDPAGKDREIGFLLSAKRERLRDELAKCDLLCALCHRRRHLALPKHLGVLTNLVDTYTADDPQLALDFA